MGLAYLDFFMQFIQIPFDFADLFVSGKIIVNKVERVGKLFCHTYI